MNWQRRQRLLENGQKFSWFDLQILCSQYGYSYQAVLLQNAFKKWTTDQIADDLGNELMKSFYPKATPYDYYTFNYENAMEEVDLNVHE